MKPKAHFGVILNGNDGYNFVKRRYNHLILLLIPCLVLMKEDDETAVYKKCRDDISKGTFVMMDWIKKLTHKKEK